MYKIGQKVCLWDLEFSFENPAVRVSREVIVTIIEIKTGAPGEFSRQPVSSQSLRAVAEDGTEYDKHWESWPESQTNTFTSHWSFRRDNGQFWTPREAMHVYNEFSDAKKKYPELQLVGIDGKLIKPTGDALVYCDKHDSYEYESTQWTPNCFWCRLDKQDLERAQALLSA